jgi:cell division protein FtsB
MTKLTPKPNIGFQTEKDERIASLEAENSELKAKVAELEQRNAELEQLVLDLQSDEPASPFDFSKTRQYYKSRS